MDNRYAEAIIDELERIGDLLEDLLRLQTARLRKNGLTEIPERLRRRANERKSTKVNTGPEPKRP